MSHTLTNEEWAEFKKWHVKLDTINDILADKTGIDKAELSGFTQSFLIPGKVTVELDRLIYILSNGGVLPPGAGQPPSGGGTLPPTKDVTYTNLEPIMAALGGIKAGETFNKATMQEMWDKLLYPYMNPTISFSTTPSSSIYAIGESTTITKLSANIGKKTEKIKKVVFKKGSTKLHEKTFNPPIGSTTIDYTFSDTINATSDYSVEVITESGKVFDASKRIEFIDAMFIGTSSTNNTADITAIIPQLTRKVIHKTNIDHAFTGPGYFTLIIPKSWGPVRVIHDPNSFDITGAFAKTDVQVNGRPYTSYITTALIDQTNYMIRFRF